MVGASAPHPPQLAPAVFDIRHWPLETLPSHRHPSRGLWQTVSETRTAPLQFGQPLPADVHERLVVCQTTRGRDQAINQTKLLKDVAEAISTDVCHDDIEKSRGAYQKRFGESVKDIDYFTQELTENPS